MVRDMLRYFDALWSLFSARHVQRHSPFSVTTNDAIIMELLLTRCRRTGIKSIEPTSCMCMFSAKYNFLFVCTVSDFGLGNQCIYNYYALGDDKSHNYIYNGTLLPNFPVESITRKSVIRTQTWIVFVFRTTLRVDNDYTHSRPKAYPNSSLLRVIITIITIIIIIVVYCDYDRSYRFICRLQRIILAINRIN